MNYTFKSFNFQVVLLFLPLLLCSFQQGAGEGEEPGGGAQRTSVRLPGPHVVGQDPAVRRGQLPARVHGPGRVPVRERHPLQPLPAPPQPQPAPAANHASSPAHVHALRDGPQQPRLHVATHECDLSKLPAQQPGESR